MNKFIKNQLNKVTRARIPEFDDNTTRLVISKGAMPKIEKPEYELDHYYLIEVDNSLVDKNNNWYKTIHGNWNSGRGPESTKLKVEVMQFAGKMIRFNATYEDNSGSWSGWLPKGNINKIKELF